MKDPFQDFKDHRCAAYLNKIEQDMRFMIYQAWIHGFNVAAQLNTDQTAKIQDILDGVEDNSQDENTVKFDSK